MLEGTFFVLFKHEPFDVHVWQYFPFLFVLFEGYADAALSLEDALSEN